MSGPKTIKRGGSRFYVHPESREKYPGVTSVIDMLPKPFLTFWAAKLAAEWATDNVGSIVQLLLNGQRETAVDSIKKAPQRFTGAAADVGTEVHDLFENMARGNKVGRLHPEIEVFRGHIGEFLDRYQPRFRFLEDTVWSDTHKYAGSFDWIGEIEIDGETETIMGDTKSTRSGVHASVALQLAAYRFADYIETQAGERVEVPPITGAAVYHVRPEGWKLVPVRADRDVFDAFLWLRRVFDWVKETEHTVIGDPLFDSQASTGSQRRASK